MPQKLMTLEEAGRHIVSHIHELYGISVTFEVVGEGPDQRLLVRNPALDVENEFAPADLSLGTPESLLSAKIAADQVLSRY